jgi:hypothetical protein
MSAVAIALAALSLDPQPPVAVAQGPGGAKPTTIAGCPTADPQAFHKCALEKGKTFKPPLTKDGKPNLQGYWDGQPTSEAIDYTLEGV